MASSSARWWYGSVIIRLHRPPVPTRYARIPPGQASRPGCRNGSGWRVEGPSQECRRAPARESSRVPRPFSGGCNCIGRKARWYEKAARSAPRRPGRLRLRGFSGQMFILLRGCEQFPDAGLGERLPQAVENREITARQGLQQDASANAHRGALPVGETDQHRHGAFHLIADAEEHREILHDVEHCAPVVPDAVTVASAKRITRISPPSPVRALASGVSESRAGVIRARQVPSGPACLDRETDAALDLVHLDDAGFDLVADLDDVLDLLHVVLAELRDVDEAVDVAIEADEGAEGGDLGDGALDEVADLEAAVDEAPWIVSAA
jgi:hypothetical protein